MKHKVIALTAALSMLGGTVAALPAMAAEQTLLNENFNSGTIGSSFDGWFIWGDGSTLLVEGDEDNKYLTATRNEAWLGAGHEITVQTGKTYNVSLKIKSKTEQIFSVSLDAITVDGQEVHPAVVMETDDRTVDSNDGWKTITGTLTIPQASVDPESNTEYSVNMWLQTNYSIYSNGSYSIDDVTITYDDSTPTSGAVAKVGDTEYTSLDAAIDAANGETITLLDNAALSENRTNATAVIEGNDHTITVTLPNGENFSSIFSNLTLSNATLTGNTNQNIANEANLTNVTVSDLSYDCFALNNLTATNCTLAHGGSVHLYAGNPSAETLQLENTTITNDKASGVCVYVRNVNATMKNTTITNTAENTENVVVGGYDGTTGSLTLSGNTAIDLIKINSTGSLTLASDFTGSAKITGISTDNGTTVATVADGASTAGITVDGLAETQELKVDGNQLVIADKPAPASFTAEVEAAEVQHGTGDYADTVATGFRATVTNNGGTKGTFSTVNWNVTFDGTTKMTNDTTIPTVTLDPNGEAVISLIVNGLDAENATATVTVK